MLTFIIIASLLPFLNCRSIDIKFPDRELPEETPEEIFLRSDSNKDNELSFDEFLQTELVYVIMKKEEFERYDKNKDGVVSRDEYEGVETEQKQQNTELRAHYFAQLFEEFDEDFDMKLSEDEVLKILAQRFFLKPRKNFSTIFRSFDSNGDRGLDIKGTLSQTSTVTILSRVSTYNSQCKHRLPKPLNRADLEYLNFDENVNFEDMEPITSDAASPILTFKKEKLPMTKKHKGTIY